MLPDDARASTLVLSSLRSEAIKGYVTRLGTRIVKGVSNVTFYVYSILQQRHQSAHQRQDITLKLPHLLLPRGQSSLRLSLSTAPDAPALVLPQLLAVRKLLDESLDIIDAARWVGDRHDTSFIAGQLWLLHDRVGEARDAIKSSDASLSDDAWTEHSADVGVCASMLKERCYSSNPSFTLIDIQPTTASQPVLLPVNPRGWTVFAGSNTGSYQSIGCTAFAQSLQYPRSTRCRLDRHSPMDWR